jgi:hypothetical protein
MQAGRAADSILLSTSLHVAHSSFICQLRHMSVHTSLLLYLLVLIVEQTRVILYCSYCSIAMVLQKAWGIRNAYKHGTSVDVFESAFERRGADGIDARA